MRTPVLLATLALSVAAAIAPLAAPLHADGPDSATLDSLDAFNDRFNEAVAARDVEGFTALYSDESLWIGPGARPTDGKTESRALIEFIAGKDGRLSHTVDTLFVSDDGTLAVMIGTADVLVEQVGMDAEGVYLFVLEKDGESWQVATDMWHQFAEE